jgi:hypothetical protein
MPLEQYAIVAQRRQQWDILLWQMPTMVLTGEAFLFTISLGPNTSQMGRIVASALALLVAFASLHSLAAHRLSELTDAVWLADHEKEHGGEAIHGLSWRERRAVVVASQRASASFTDRLVAKSAKIRPIAVWFWSMGLIAGTALGVLIVASVAPNLLWH